MGHWCAQVDRAAAAAGLEAQVAQLTLDLASKEEYFKNLQAQSSTAAATEPAKASGAPSSDTQGIKELESELATAQENLRAAEEAVRQRAEELGRWATAADRAAADQVCYVCWHADFLHVIKLWCTGASFRSLVRVRSA